MCRLPPFFEAGILISVWSTVRSHHAHTYKSCRACKADMCRLPPFFEAGICVCARVRACIHWCVCFCVHVRTHPNIWLSFRSLLCSSLSRPPHLPSPSFFSLACCISLTLSIFHSLSRASPLNWQHTTTHCSILHHTATPGSTLQHTAAHCNTLHHTATHCNTLQHTATHCNTLQTHCSTLQHTATRRQQK